MVSVVGAPAVNASCDVSGGGIQKRCESWSRLSI